MLRNKFTFEAIGTHWAIETDINLPHSLKESIHIKIEEFDKTYSRFRNDSLVTQVSKKPGVYTFPLDVEILITFYKMLYDLTNGKVTPLIGDMLARSGYDADYSFISKTQEPIMKWSDAMEWKGATLKTSQPFILDVGAAGKGYLIDIIAKILEQNSINDYVIDASGDIRHKGKSENRVGLEHPLTMDKIIGVIDVKNKSLCASASNRRVWGEGMHHIFDPDEMLPTQKIIATWVVADTAMVADGLATALFFIDPATLKSTFDYEFARMYADGSLEYSPLFKEAIF